MADAGRRCRKCKEWKQLDSFYTHKTGKGGFRTDCKACHIAKVRESTLRRQYGITLDEYTEMLVRQGGCCAGCGRKVADGETLAVDHCHKSGLVRSLLCRRCNLILGQAGEDPKVLQNLTNYVSRHRVQRAMAVPNVGPFAVF